MASAPSMTTYLSNKVLGYLLGGVSLTIPATLFLGLATSCNAAGTVTGEPTIGQKGYTRVQFSNSKATITVTNSTTTVNVTGGTTTYPVGTIVAFGTTDTLPQPLVAATPYFVVGGSGSTITVATSPGGTAITFTSTGSGTNSLIPAFGTAASAQISNAIALTFPQDVTTDWGAMSIFFITDAATAGNAWLYNAISGATTIAIDQTPYFPATLLVIGPMA